MQVMTDTILPLGVSFWGLMLDGINIDTINTAGGRIYLDITHNLTGKIGFAHIKQKMSQSDQLMDDALKQVYARNEYIKTIPKGKASQFAIPKTIGPALIAGWKAYRKNDPAMIDAYERRMVETQFSGCLSAGCIEPRILL